MERNKILYFNVFGFFNCRETEEKETALKKAGKKVLSFLQYFVVNHKRTITSEELIDQFWSEKNSVDPANSLKNMIFKVRSLLKNMYPEQESLILTLPGCYMWKTSVWIQLDSEEFEQVCLEAGKCQEKADLKSLLTAVSLYKGDFLSGNDSDWVIPLRRYYQTLYLDACRMLLPLLQEQRQWTEMLHICERAFAVDSSADIFVDYEMEALIAMGYPERALETYRNFRDLLWKEFETEPEERTEKIRIQADGLCQNTAGSRDILKQMAKTKMKAHAFLCTFRLFQKIVSLEKRHLSYAGHSSVLVLVSLNGKAKAVADAKRLERILLEQLKIVAPVSRLGAGAYVMMLSRISVENAYILLEQLDRAFHKTYAHSSAFLSYEVILLKAEKD